MREASTLPSTKMVIYSISFSYSTLSPSWAINSQWSKKKAYKIHWTDKTAHSLSLTLLVLLFYMARLRIKTHSYTIYLSSAQRRRRRRYRDDRFSFNGFLSSSILPYNFLKYHCAIVEQLCMLEEKKNEEIKAESARISS